MLHPANMVKTTIKDLKQRIDGFAKFYDLENLKEGIELWYNTWINKQLDDEQLKDLEMIEVLKEADIFHPAIQKAIYISLAQPCTTCTIERSFSTLRRVKTWLRSTMGESRLNGKIFI